MTLSTADVATGARDGGVGRATGWAVAMDSGGQVVNLIVSMLLAALLGPEAFGLVAMALVYLLFIQLVQQQGMQAAVIQRQNLTAAHENAAFWMVMVSSAALTGVSVLLAGWWARFNGEPELQPLLYALSALLPIRGLATVQEALVRRDMRFKPLAVRTLSATAGGGLLGVTGALLGWGVWALVAQQLGSAVVGVFLLWSLSGWRPGWRTSRCAVRELVGFSSGSFLSSIAVFLNNRADVLLMGLFFGPVVVGIYRFGGTLVDSALTMITRPVQSVSLPALSRHQGDDDSFGSQYLRLSRLSAWAALPALGGLAGGAGALVDVLGDEWAPAEWPLRVLVLVGVVRLIINLDGPMLQARGLVYLQAAVSWVGAALSCAALLAAAALLRDQSVATQAVGIGLTRAVVYGSVIMIIHVVLIRRACGIPVRPALAVFGPACAASAALAVTIGGVDTLLASVGGAAWLRLTVACVLSLCGLMLFSRRLLLLLILRRGAARRGDLL